MKKFCACALTAALVNTAVAASAFGLAGGAAATPASVAPFDYKVQFLSDMKDLQTKFVGLGP